MKNGKPRRPPLVRAELAPKRYRLAIVEEHTDHVVMRLPVIPDSAVQFIARQLAALVPTLVQAASYRDMAAKLADLLRPNGGRGAR